MSHDDERSDCDVHIQKVHWKDIDDHGIELILSNSDEELRSSLTSKMVQDIVGLLLEAIGVEDYEYRKAETQVQDK